jgi:hypothetical protein
MDLATLANIAQIVSAFWVVITNFFVGLAVLVSLSAALFVWHSLPPTHRDNISTPTVTSSIISNPTVTPTGTSTALVTITPSPTENPKPYPPSNAKLIINDSLHQPDNWWQNYNSPDSASVCQFTNEGYNVIFNKLNNFIWCQSQTMDLNNFAFEVKTKIIQGTCGGFIFGPDLSQNDFYFFEVCQNGDYHLHVISENNNTITDNILTKNNHSSAIHFGLNQFNIIAIVSSNCIVQLYY